MFIVCSSPIGQQDSNSIKIVLAFPPEAYAELSKVLDEQFMKTQQLQVRPHLPSLSNHTQFCNFSLHKAETKKETLPVGSKSTMPTGQIQEYPLETR